MRSSIEGSRSGGDPSVAARAVPATSAARGAMARGVAAARGSVAAFRAALGLLTRLPVHAADADGDAVATAGAAAFPLVGAALGLAAAIPILLLPARDAVLAAPLAIGVGVLLDGALHLDGLADSADALVAPTPAAAERARTDPRIGAAGGTALVLVLAVDVAALALLGASDRGLAALALVAAAAAGRAGVAVAAPRVRVRGGGFGSWFRRLTRARDAVVAFAFLLLVAGTLSFVGGSPLPAIAAGSAFGGSVLALAHLARRGDGATGDSFGAAIEVGFAVGLVAAALARP